jgi:hypothetical protein
MDQDACSICDKPLVERQYEDDGYGDYAHTDCLDKRVYGDSNNNDDKTEG